MKNHEKILASLQLAHGVYTDTGSEKCAASLLLKVSQHIKKGQASGDFPGCFKTYSVL